MSDPPPQHDATAPAHLPVMPRECLELLSLSPGDTVLDATLGAGGHAGLMLAAVGPRGRLIGIDRDTEALAEAGDALRSECAVRGWPQAPVTLIHDNFGALERVLDEADVGEIAGCLLDLGVSSMQLDRSARGFSFQREGPLDMRMDRTTGRSAWELLRDVEGADLERILRDYGEERFARRVTARLKERAAASPPPTTLEVAEIVRRAYPPDARHGRIHPATRTFQALRIAVNEELAAIEPAILGAIGRLRPGGRLVVLAYHSLEDRIVKRALLRESGRCSCPPEFPQCTCGCRRRVEILTRHPMRPSEEEVALNPRARSARLRAASRMAEGEA